MSIFVGLQPDGCKDSGLNCPLVEGESYSYPKTINVENNYPRIKFILQWKLITEENKTLFCVKIPVKIV